MELSKRRISRIFQLTLEQVRVYSVRGSTGIGSYLNPIHLPKSTPVVSLFDIVYEMKMAICLGRSRLRRGFSAHDSVERVIVNHVENQKEPISKDGGNMIDFIAIVLQRNVYILKIHIVANSKCVESFKFS